jgi:hypothetical protein
MRIEVEPATRRRRGGARLMLAAIVVGVVALGLADLPARADDATVSYDNFRTGWDPNEPALNAGAADFGQLFDTSIGGAIYAQPIVAGSGAASSGTLIVASETNQVAGLDPATGAIEWQRSLGAPWPSATINCGNSGARVGVTSTPVYDPATNSVYVMAKTDDGPNPQHPHWRLHALNPATGAERSGWPVVIHGAPDNDPQHPFNPETEAQRPGLLLLGGVVYAGFASLCDIGPYVGDIVGVSTTTADITAIWSDEAGTADGEAGIWQSGGGLVSDGPNQIIVATGNGTTSAPSPGNQPPDRLGESVVRVEVDAAGKLHAADYFTPVNGTLLNTDDIDLGSGGPLAIPGSFDGKHLLVEVGKDGRVFLLDRDDLGGNAQGPGGTDDVLGVTGPFNGVWGHPAYWPGPAGTDNQGGYVYDVENQGYLRAFQLGTDSADRPVLSSIGNSAQTFGYTSGSPVVTSNGTTAGSALVWVTYVDNDNGSNAELRAYSAIPHDGVMQLVRSFPIGNGSKFVVAATDDNRVFVANRSGDVYGFGTPTGAAVAASPTNFGDVDVGTTSVTRTVDVRATRAVQVDSVTALGPFDVTSAATPATLGAGGELPVSVTFTPTSAGEVDLPLQVRTTEKRVTKTVYLDLFGTGTQDGLAPNPPALAFGDVPTSATKTFDVNVVNTGTTAAQIASAVISGSAQFRLGSGNPAGASIPPQGSLAVPVVYAPTEAASDSATLVVTSTGGGTEAVVQLSGTAVSGAANLTVTPNPIQFPATAVGGSSTERMRVRNTGNIALTISKAATPSGEFTVPSPVDEGLTLPPGEALTVPIVFAPTAPGPATATYTINSDAGNGAQVEQLSGTGTDPIADYYAFLNGRFSTLGRPVGPEVAVGNGRMRVYRHGRIYWSAATGAHALTGKVLSHYLVLGGPTGFAGFPVTDVQPVALHSGRRARFARSGAVIYYSKRSGAWAVNGGIAKRWSALGGVHSKLGYPTSDEYGLHHHRRRSDFQHGQITYHAGSGRTTVSYDHGKHHKHHKR